MSQLLVTACSLRTLGLCWDLDGDARWPNVQPFGGASKNSAALLAKAHKLLASEKSKRFFSRIWGLTGI